MGEILRFLRQNESWIYLVLGVVAFVYVLRLLSVWREWRAVNFGLEREIIQRKVGAALAFLFLCVLFAVAEFILVSFVAPNMANTQQLSTPTIDLMLTPTTTMEARVTPVTTDSQPFQPTPTLVLIPNGCVANRLEWTYPLSGDRVKGSVTLEGTVNYDNLGFYKYEYSQVGSNIWNPIAAGDKKVIKAALGGPWNTSQLTPGDYHLRLVATDNNDNPFPACEITITVLMADD